MRPELLASVAAADILTGTNALAIVASPPPRLCSMYSSADMVLVGAVGRESVTADGAWKSWPVRTERTYKGSPATRFQLFTANDSARATPNPGKLNVLFVRIQDGRMTAWGDDANTSGAELSRIENGLKALAHRSASTTGSVMIWVASEQGVGRPHTTLRLKNLHTAGIRTIKTNAQGHAKIDLPAGRWQVHLAESGVDGRASLYGYNNPDDFNLARGGCADLRIEPINSRKPM